MTPQKCLETRLRLGWTRQDLASAASVAAPIVRLFEAGALDGFDDCADAIETALGAEETRRAHKPPTRKSRARESWLPVLAEAGVRWNGPDWTPRYL